MPTDLQDLPAHALLAGAAKRDITCFLPGIGMLGWAMYYNTVHDIDQPIYARAFWFEDPRTGSRLAYVHCEIAFITQAVREDVVARLGQDHPELGLAEHNLLLTANHTHAAPGGYSRYFMYNISIPGFAQQVLDTIVDGIVNALVAAEAAKEPARLHRATGRFPEDTPVAFNRSWRAYSSNPENERIDFEHRHLGVDREMVLLRIEGVQGQPIGLINWFAVHTTNMHSDQHAISPDNKGWAAKLIEEELAAAAGAEGFVAAFSQGAAGDVTPNYRRYKGLPEMRGPSPDDKESVRINGRYQAELARQLYDQALHNPPEPVQLDGKIRYADMSDRPVNPAFAKGREGQSTKGAMMGHRMLGGTAEGEGLPWFGMFFIRLISEIKGLGIKAGPMQQPKKPVMDLIAQKQMGVHYSRLLMPGFLHRDHYYMRLWGRNGGVGSSPLAPIITPAQIAVLGGLTIAALPGEPTTTAGRRMRQTLEEVMADYPSDRAVVMGYSNAYAGYITTYEEYHFQNYEGSSTPFGKWTAAAYRTTLYELARELIKPPHQRNCDPGPPPHKIPEEELAARAWVPPEER
jgi:neutral ceramidase